MERDPWATFQVVEDPEEDEWAGFQEVEPAPTPAPSPAPSPASSKPPRKRGGLIGGNSPYLLPRFSNPTATDGDTIRDGETRIRLQGIDAPELAQRGWRSDGSTVPLGELSQQYLSEQIYSPENLALASKAGTSFGRIVGRVENDGQDIGLGSLRAGQSFAAPDYITDPDIRFDYLEAQRLARRNRLGVHGTVTLTPDEFRANLDYVPDRKTTAQFADMPTPETGMTAEEEQQYLHLLRVGDAEQIFEFFKGTGYRVDPQLTREFIDFRDKALAKGWDIDEIVGNSFSYGVAERELIDPEDGQTGAAIRQYSAGFLLNSLDELGAFPDTLGLTDGRENVWNSDRRLADIYWNNQRQNQAILSHDEYAYPGTSTTANIAGSLTSGFLLPYARGVATAPQLAKYGAAYGSMSGALGAEGGLGNRAVGAIQGGTIGAIADPALGKAVDALTPAARRFGQSLRGRVGSPPPGANDSIPINPPVVGPITPEIAEQVARPRTADEFLTESAESIRTKDFTAMVPQGDAWQSAVIDPNGRIHLLQDGVGHREFGEAIAPEEAAGFASLTRYGGEIAHRPAAQPTQRQQRTIDELRARGGREGIAVTEGGVSGSVEPAYPLPSGSMAMAARGNEALTQDLARPRPLLEPSSRSELLASASNIRPGDVLPMPSNVPEGGELAEFNASRFEVARPVPEQSALTRGTVTNWRGQPVPNVGPLDMIGFIRSQGGLRDQGGELSAMGFNNAARRGLDHVGQETRFGPLVNDTDGMSLDEAAFAAWEAGYLPEFSERPSVNEFLDALRDTYEGGAGRRFLPEDFGQVETFDALRGERFDLERTISESDVPIYQDNSVPALDERAFPPVEAYEDWAGDTIERVGNIDVTKLDSPQDIKRALKTTHNTMGGFDAATRSRISQGETERLAEELGMTAKDLLARRKGQAFNAEEALAARQILAKSGNELVNAARRIQGVDTPGDEALAEFRQMLLRHTAIQEQVAGMTAEAGRTLQQFRQAANSRAVRGDVLSAFVRSGGGQNDLKNAADLLVEAAELSPGQFATTARRVNDPKFRDKVGELYINALLSNPPTHVVNMVSNALTSVAQIPEHAFASGIGATRRAVMGERAGDRILASEVGARAFGLLQGTREGLQLFAKALRTGEADDFVSKVEGDQFNAISGFKGEVIRLPTRFLTAEDQLFKGIARRMELNAQAVRVAHKEGLTGDARTARIAELVANPTDDMLERALDYGRYLTFQRQLTGIGQDLSSASGKSLPVKVVVPFVRTPINLLKFATERSPAAPLLKEWRDDFRAGGERRDLAVARAMLGTGLAYSIYDLAQQGLITGAAPSDPAKARLMYADGWQPYSIKVGDRYISYSRLDPLSTTLGVAADMATLPAGMNDRQRENMGTMMVASIMNNLASKTWLSGVSSLTAGLADPQRNAENWLERLAASFATPAVMGGAARQVDPVVRQREGVGEAIQSRIPGLSQDLYPARNVFGEPRETDSLGPDFISPFWQSKDRNDPVVAEMLRIQKSVSAPGKQFTEDGERIDYPRETYDRYHEIAGRLTYNNLLALIGSQPYPRMNDGERRRAAKKAIREAREAARSVLADPDYPLPPKGAGATDTFQDYLADDPFAGFPAEGDADPWAGFQEAAGQ